MKHLYLFLAAFLAAAGLQAQMVTVTFNLNMANETVSAEGPHLAGGADFGIPGDNPMTDDDGDGIWTITIEVESGYTGYYTFTNGACADWSCKENIAGLDCAHPENYNDRQLENITENTEINTCFGQCTTDGSCQDPGGAVNVTFQVDMNNESVGGDVFMSGSFDGWCGCTPMTDDDGDGIYTYTLSAQPGGFEWKFLNGSWDGAEIFDPELDAECTLTTGEFTNRFVIIEGPNAMVLDPFCFNTCSPCSETPCVDPAQIDSTAICPGIYSPVCGCDGVTYNNGCEAFNYGGVSDFTDGPCSTSAMVTFRVDMSEQDDLGTVYITGSSIDGWSGNSVAMSDDDGDDIYEATLEIDAGDHEYKFKNGDDWANAEEFNEADSLCTLTTIDGGNTYINRLFTLIPGSSDVVLDAVCFNSCDECEEVEVPDTEVTFNVDMSEQTVSGAVYISGGTLDGWAGSQIELTDPDGDNVYSVTLELPQGNHEYKYMIGSWDINEALDAVEDSACTITTGGFTNRLLVISSEEAIDLPVHCYESCDACAPAGVDGIEALSFRVFPSVTDGIVTVAFPSPLAEGAEIEVLDMGGRMVRNSNLGAGMTQLRIDLTNEADGFYVVRVTSGLQVATERVVKQH